jgi:hypothetical protein
MKLRLLSLLIILLVGAVLPAQAQFVQDTLDHGVTDTVDMVLSVAPDFTTNQLKVQFDLYGFNDVDTLSGAAMGFSWLNPNMLMDSAHATPLSVSAWDFIISVYEGQNINLTNANKRFPFVGARIFAVGMLPAPARRLWASYYFSLSSWAVTDSIVLDTLAYNGGVTWVFNNPNGDPYLPYFTGKEVVRDSVSPSNLIITPDTLFFTEEAGGPFPPNQNFTVSSDGSALDFDLIENAPWLIKSPAFGTTPRNITVSINTTGLASGIYFDSIEVSSPEAANSPLFKYVQLELTEPPAELNVTPSQLFFNAIAGGSNPASQMLSVFNTGGGQLDWTATNNESWLMVNPMSGQGDASLTISVDITGLTFNDYFDTIVVSDPSAENSPRMIPVRLTVASDLPVIQVSSNLISVIVDLPEATPGPEYFEVTNAGGGLMNFTATTTSPRITLTPDSGAAPATVEASFTVAPQPPNTIIDDTVWVASNEAINSPQPVIFRFRFVDIPAVIVASPVTLTFDIYECSEPDPIFPLTHTFNVVNGGGDDPLQVILDYQSDIIEVDKDTTFAPDQFTVTATAYDLPVGNYKDTIFVTAIKAINSPDTIFIEYNIIPGDQPPVIALSKSSTTLILKEGAGPQLVAPIRIDNGVPGCMEWSLTEDIAWLFPSKTGGTATDFVSLLVDPTGLTLGQYVDTVDFLGVGATNSPKHYPVTLKIWRYNGDINWSGTINLTDLTLLVLYLFQGGNPPQPTVIVGDLTCDGLVNLSDVTYMVSFLFNGGPFPCGNPFK